MEYLAYFRNYKININYNYITIPLLILGILFFINIYKNRNYKKYHNYSK